MERQLKNCQRCNRSADDRTWQGGYNVEQAKALVGDSPQQSAPTVRESNSIPDASTVKPGTIVKDAKTGKPLYRSNGKTLGADVMARFIIEEPQQYIIEEPQQYIIEEPSVFNPPVTAGNRANAATSGINRGIASLPAPCRHGRERAKSGAGRGWNCCWNGWSS